ncbi:glycosyltransferase family 1 protein [Leuconostoc citreum]|uniref:glycosyltransferase n=1 Tax=Leuconostoc citreum TaxID=33964 RepID=UPI0021825266|nr:glycosyltransferase [Leuconostoc citreum]MCS8594983.1 glycosyltransferase family 1 protein [Leuconostoc citreum]
MSNKQLHILIIGMTPNKGGTETFSMNLFYGIREKYPDIKVTFLNIWDKDIAYQEEIIQSGGFVLHYKMPTGIKNIFFGYKMAKQLFSENEFDVVHVNANYLLPSYFAIGAKKSGVNRVIFHSHNSSYGNRSVLKKTFLEIISIVQRQCLKKNSIILLAASNEAGCWMFKRLKYMVISNGVNVDNFLFDNAKRQAVRNNLHISNKSKIIISVARMEYQKNHEKIILIFNELSKLDNYYLILVGTGSQEKKIKATILELGLATRVKILGSRKDISELLMASDLMIMPSRYEGLPFSAIEAQASGLSLVVSSEAFDKEVNIINKITYLSNNDGDQKWAQTINKIIDLNMLSDRTKDNILVTKSKYSFEVTLKEVIPYYFDENEIS